MAKNDPNDKTWQFIWLALIRARTFAKAFGHTWQGDSCSFVSGLALGLVIDTRNSATSWGNGDGGPTLPTDDPGCTELAYADHYLQMRAMAGMFGPAGGGANLVIAKGYDTLKQTAFDLRDMGKVNAPSLVPNPLNPASMIPDLAKLAQAGQAMLGMIAEPIGNAIIRKMQENPNKPMSRPSVENSYWVAQGTRDGAEDFRIINVQAEYKILEKYAAWIKAG